MTPGGTPSGVIELSDPTSSGPAWLLFGAPVAVLLFVGVWLPPVLSGPFAAVARVLEVTIP